MDTVDHLNIASPPVEEQTSFESVSMREGFSEWLKNGNAKKYSTEVILSCMDRISDYAVRKKISMGSLWENQSFNTFKPLYQKLEEEKLLRITDRNNYKVFVLAGQLYLCFLKEKPWKAVVTDNNASDEEGYIEAPVEKVLKDVPALIPKDVVPEETDASLQAPPLTRLAFRKEVDWSLLNYGFTVPQTAVDEFCSNVDGEVLRGNSRRIILLVGDIDYTATLSNVGFSNDLRKQLQVRYSASSPVAAMLRKIFKSSYECFVERKNNGSGSGQAESKEYAEVVSISPNKYGLICFPLSNGIQDESSIHPGSADILPLEYTQQHSGYGNKYDPLKFWLTENDSDSIQMTFSEITELVGSLPPSAYQHRAFWSNADSHPFATAWMAAGYKVAECDLQSEVVRLDRCNVRNAYTRTRRATVKAALIEFSNNYKGEIKTRREIVEELSAKYGHNKYSILPADYEIGLSNREPKLFKRIDHGTYLCMGYDTAQNGITALSRTQVDGYSLICVNEKSKLIGIVADKFKNGFRMSSSIEFERFKNYYADEYGKEFQYAADRLHNVLSNEALVFDDRAYVYGEDVSDTVRIYLEQMNSPCIYIDAFFNKYSDELYAFTIFSVDMLRAFIEKNYYDISVKWDYILLQESTSPSDLIKDVFGERETWSFDELLERLPCLKMDTIKQTLNGAVYYRVDKGTYTHIDNMDLPESEGAKIIAFVVSKLQERDYVTANELDLSKFENLNPHCSFAAVRDAVFYKFLSNSYDKSGQVITRKGGKLRVLDIMEQYCRKADAVSFDELNAFEATFDPEGRTHSQCLIAGHNTMVRVSSDLFVSDGNVDFDVARIDEAIALYCHGNFIPLRGVTDFSLFPYAGYQWNLFLLESYVRRFSHVFKYDVRAVNSANIGAIVRKSFEYNNYDDILVLALAKSLVRLSDKKAVGDYLFNNGYIGWRNLGKSEGKIIRNARNLREEGTV
jgi:hypothetical protein